MTHLYLIRHGLTDAVAGHWVAGRRHDISLNADGHRQAAETAERLARAPLVAVYASPRARTRETAAAIAAPHRLPVETEPGLDEYDSGAWQGCLHEELDRDAEWRRFNTRRSLAWPEGGEMMLEAQARIVAAAERLRRRHPDEHIALVSHGDPLRALVAHHLGVPLDHQLRFEIGPASVTLLAVDGTHSVLHLLNHTGALPAWG